MSRKSYIYIYMCVCVMWVSAFSHTVHEPEVVNSTQCSLFTCGTGCVCQRPCRSSNLNDTQAGVLSTRRCSYDQLIAGCLVFEAHL